MKKSSVYELGQLDVVKKKKNSSIQKYCKCGVIANKKGEMVTVNPTISLTHLCIDIVCFAVIAVNLPHCCHNLETAHEIFFKILFHTLFLKL